ncbi:MAG: type II toxin-antitoxin system VapC family toxin [Chloroflexota bacterium]|nr:type II toxin-antitoxin system VapC family toxin [Chloroflexota bacterium]
MRACYLDASALVKLATLESETAALREHLASYSQRSTSRLAMVEVPRALTRKGTDGAGVEALHVVFEGIVVINLDEGIAAIAAALSPGSLRSLDAIHLASAISIGQELDAFITYDIRLADAARAAGLTVVIPA